MSNYQTIGDIDYAPLDPMPESLRSALETTFPVSEYYNLSKKVVHCSKCVLSNQRPRNQFDQYGVCGACRFTERKDAGIDWGMREKELVDLLDRHRKSDGSWDVLVPSSGGKDSAFVAHTLKFKYGMNPLTVTWAPHIYTAVGWYNLQKNIHAGLDNICGTPNGYLHRVLTRASLIKMGDIFQPFIYGQKAFPISMSVKMGIPLVMFGENGEVEYGGDPKNANSPTHDLTEDMEKHYNSGFDLTDWEDANLSKTDLHYYQMPSIEKAEELGIECHFMGYYKKWVPQENYYYAFENMGTQPEPDGRSEGTYSKYASLDDRLAGYHNYFAWLKFGHGRATSDAAHEIRDRHINRKQGVALVKDFDGEFPKKHFLAALSYLSMSEDEFFMCCDRFRNTDLFQQSEDGIWGLKTPVWLTEG